MTHQDIDSFKFYLGQNHLQSSLGNGRFNPCMKLLTRQKPGNEDFDKLVFHHESLHSHLSSCAYGEFIMFLKYISIDVMLWHTIENLDKISNTNKFILKINNLVKHMLSSWVITQEGLTTLYDYNRIKINNSLMSTKYGNSLLMFLEQDTPYKVGYSKIKRLESYYDSAEIKFLIHQLGNLNFTSKSNRTNTISPDERLDEYISRLIEYGTNRIVLVKDRIPYLQYILEPLGYQFQDRQVTYNLFNQVIQLILDGELVPKGYIHRLRYLEKDYHHKIRNFTTESYDYNFLFCEVHIDQTGELTIEEDIHPKALSPVHKAELKFLNKCNYLQWKYAQSNPTKLKLEIKNNKNILGIYQAGILNFFVDCVQKPSKLFSEIASEYIAISKNHYGRLTDMFEQKIDIVCKPDQAQKLLNALNIRNEQLIPHNHPSLNTYLQSPITTLTIVPSSNTILQTIEDWIYDHIDKDIAINTSNEKITLSTAPKIILDEIDKIKKKLSFD